MDLLCRDAGLPLADEIAALAAMIDAATCELLHKIRAFDESEAWADEGAVSCAAWLAWRLGWNGGVAREKVRVARAIAELPLIADSLSRGELSYSKVRAMTRVATPDNEETLLEIARYSTAAQLEKICRLYAGATEPMSEEAEREKRWVSHRVTCDGMVRITMQLPAEEAERVLTAMAACDSGDLADGAVEMAESRLRGNAEERSPVDISVHMQAFVHQSEQGPKGQRSATTTAGVEHTDGKEPPVGWGSPSWGPTQWAAANLWGAVTVSAETSKRLLCDAGIAPVLEDSNGRVLSVGRKTRTVPAAIKRALNARGATCSFPGCDRRRFLDAHHIHHWADGGHTSLENLTLLCRRHHLSVHEHGYTVLRSTTGELVFSTPEGTPITHRPRPPARPIENRDTTITPATNAPMWDGTTPQWDACVEALLPRSP